MFSQLPSRNRSVWRVTAAFCKAGSPGDGTPWHLPREPGNNGYTRGPAKHVKNPYFMWET